MTASEKLIALAEARANSPENMRDLLTLVLDRATSAKMSEINYEIGHEANSGSGYRWMPRYSDAESLQKDKDHADWQVRREQQLNGAPSDYALILQEYVGLKLQLHRLRKTMYYPYDAYCEKEGDFTAVLERCKELREKIRVLRGNFPAAVWGDFQPEPAAKVDDKPLLHAFSDYTCSYFIFDNTEDRNWLQCPLAGEHWYRGLPYCREHLGQARHDVKMERKYKVSMARRKHYVKTVTGEWAVSSNDEEQPPCTYVEWDGRRCTRRFNHAHYGGRIEPL